MTALDFIRLTRANLALIFICASAGLLVMFLYTVRQPTLYTATSTGYVKVGQATSAGEAMTNMSLETSKATSYTQLISTTEVTKLVAQELQLPEGASLPGTLTASSNEGQMFITGVAGTPADATNLANAGVKALAQEIKIFENAGKPEGAADSNLVQLLPAEQAVQPSSPSSPVYGRNLMMGGLAGLGLGYAVGLLRRSADRRARSVADVEESGKTSVVGIIPLADPLSKDNRGVHGDLGPAAEAFRTLRTNLRFVDVDKPPRSIVITSANAGEGKSTVAANLARVIAATGQRVVLIDADLRRPTLAKTYDLDPAVGLTQVLAGDVTIEEAMQESSYPNLRLVPAGRTPPNPSELLGSQRMHAVINGLTDDYLVLLDAPPLLPVTDAGLLSATCDGAILVTVVGKTYREQIEQCRKILDQVGGRVLGTVLNRAPIKGLGSVVYGYGYGNYRTDYYSRRVYERRSGNRIAKGRDRRGKAGDRDGAGGETRVGDKDGVLQRIQSSGTQEQ